MPTNIEPLSEADDLLLIDLLTRKLAFKLVAGDVSLAQPVALVLDTLPIKPVLTIMRQNIGIELIVKNNLDEDGEFCSLLKKINTAITDGDLKDIL